MMEKQRWKVITFVVCWVGYTMTYLLRTNLSLVLPGLLESTGITKAQGGLFGTAFFWTYALGQLLSGYLGDRLPPRRIVEAGMLLSITVNLLMGFTTNYGAMLLFWTLNGFALALTWPPIVRILSSWFTPEEYNRVSVYMGLSLTIGFILSWGVTGAVVGWLGPRWGFWFPALVTAVFLAFMHRLLYDTPAQRGLAPEPPVPPLSGGASASEAPSLQKKAGGPGRSAVGVAAPARGRLFTAGLLLVCLLAVTSGLIKEGINLWAPTLLQESAAGGSSLLVSSVSVLIPLVGSVGILLTGRVLSRFAGAYHKTLLLLLLGGFLFTLLLVLCAGSFLGLALCIGCVMATIYGVNLVLTTVIPLQAPRRDKISLLSGVVNFASNLGAAAGGWLTGLLGAFGWGAVYLFWAAVALFSLLAMALRYRRFSLE